MMDMVDNDGSDAVAGVAVEQLHRRVPAVAERLTQLRLAVADWATRLGLAADLIEDLVLATYEAIANVVEHAYRDCLGGLFDLCARADRTLGTVTVTVTDYGRWRPPPADPGSRGRGLPLIHHLAEHADIVPSPHGTTVTMTYRIT
jgi:serine/threonine-protein kinase RsbW